MHPQPALEAGAAPDVAVVYTMHKCHVDLGFTAPESAVMRDYLDVHIPRAIEVADRLRARGGEERFRWTLPAYVLYRYFEQADEAGRALAADAIVRGDLSWHALPFTTHTELLDEQSIRALLSFSARLDARFGVRTRSARATDIPGHTQGLIGPLVEYGVEFLDLGCNPSCTAPQVPHFGPAGILDPFRAEFPATVDPTEADRPALDDADFLWHVVAPNEVETNLFRWFDPQGNSLTVLDHRHGYGGTVRLAGTDIALSMRVRMDNGGPEPLPEVLREYRNLHRKFPNARIVAADLNEIADVLEPLAAQLPQVHQEIGDTWIYGTGADPAKTQSMRELIRLRGTWLADGDLVAGSDTDLAMLADLLRAAEHTWGPHVVEQLEAWDVYTPSALAEARATQPKFQQVEAEFARKGNLPRAAIDHLPVPLAGQARAALESLRPQLPELAGLRAVDGPLELHGPGISARIDPASGALASLVDTESGREWASGPVGEFVYQTFDAAAYDRYFAAYNTHPFAIGDFTKPGLANFPCQARQWHPVQAQLLTDDQSRAVAVLEMPEPPNPEMVSWPTRIVIEYRAGHRHIDVRLVLTGKRATRLPEAMWLAFPLRAHENQWRIDKSGIWVDPRDVIAGGARHLHGFITGFRCGAGDDAAVSVLSPDAHLAAPGGPGLLTFDDAPLDLAGQGMWINLFNNCWGTNFPQWCDQDMAFRYRLSLE